MQCDICNADAAPESTHQIPNGTFKQMVAGGYNPFLATEAQLQPAVDAAKARGVGRKELAASWREKAFKDSTDWTLCDACYQSSLRSKHLSQWQRVSNIFGAPSKTFEDIKNGHTSWWLPFLLFVVVGTGLWVTVNARVSWPTVVDNSLRMSPRQADRLAQLTPEQQETQKRISAAAQKYIWMFAPVGVLLMNLIAAGVLLGTINFGFGGRAKFGQVLAVSWYAGLPGLLKLLLGIVGLFAGVAPESFLPGNAAGTNIGYYLPAPPETNFAVWTLLVALDITIIWTLILFSKGLAKVAGTKSGSGYIAVFGWWILALIVQIGITAAFS